MSSDQMPHEADVPITDPTRMLETPAPVGSASGEMTPYPSAQTNAPPTDAPPTDAPPKSSVQRIGPYRVLGVLGQGGMGVVYKAHDDELDRPVAIKLILQRMVDLAGAERLREEARAAARLSHPGIVAVYQFGQHGASPYLAMEYVQGEPLDQKIKREGPMDPVLAIRLILQAAEALEYAAQRHIIHRDIKPANLMLSAGGECKVMDLGLAKRLDDDPGLTGTGLMVGTPAYMPPEQARGQELDFRSDMYALGCTLFALLKGSAPFDTRSAQEAILAHATKPIPVPPAWAKLAGGELVAVLERMTAKDRDKRFPTWGLCVEALKHCQLALEGKVLPRGVDVKKGRRRALAWPKAGIAAAVVAMLFVVVFAWPWKGGGKDRPQASTPALRAEAATPAVQEASLSGVPSTIENQPQRNAEGPAPDPPPRQHSGPAADGLIDQHDPRFPLMEAVIRRRSAIMQDDFATQLERYLQRAGPEAAAASTEQQVRDLLNAKGNNKTPRDVSCALVYLFYDSGPEAASALWKDLRLTPESLPRYDYIFFKNLTNLEKGQPLEFADELEQSLRQAGPPLLNGVGPRNGIGRPPRRP